MHNPGKHEVYKRDTQLEGKKDQEKHENKAHQENLSSCPEVKSIEDERV